MKPNGVHLPEWAAGFTPGTVLKDTYQIVRPLASGGSGEVYVAAHMRLPGEFAVKVLHPELIHDENSLSRFRREAEIMAGLHHPHIVQVFDFNVTEDGIPFVVMELLEGMELNEYVSQRGKLSLKETVSIIHQIASALTAAHELGIVHCDLKPANVVLVKDGNETFVKVVDFGISRTRWMKREPNASTIMGTPGFMAPEQIAGGEREVDHRADQFALGAITYTLLTGREPFRGADPTAILYQVLNREPSPLRVFVGWPAGPVQAVLDRALRKKPANRFGSIAEFATALEGAAVLVPASDGASVVRGAAPSRTTSRALRKRMGADTRRLVRNTLHRGRRIASIGLVAIAVAIVSASLFAGGPETAQRLRAARDGVRAKAGWVLQAVRNVGRTERSDSPPVAHPAIETPKQPFVVPIASEPASPPATPSPAVDENTRQVSLR